MTREQWCPFAIQRIGAQGATAKRGYPNGVQGVANKDLLNATKRGEIKHDSGGPLSATLGVLDTHPINSWQFTVDDSGIYQHYPVDANCWHGNDTDPDQDVRANIELVGVEHTRANGNAIGQGPALKLSPTQIELTAKLTRWLADNGGRPQLLRYAVGLDAETDQWLECEHGEVGNTWTDCPSHRIPWAEVFALAEGEDDMASILRREQDQASGLEFLYLYNGPVPIRRYGSTMRAQDGSDERAGREALNFGGKWFWQRYFTDENTETHAPGTFIPEGFLSLTEGD